jgi:hypothetical protein
MVPPYDLRISQQSRQQAAQASHALAHLWQTGSSFSEQTEAQWSQQSAQF